MGRFTRKIAIAAATPVLLLGGTALATTTASAATAHVVTPGETLSGIASQNGTSVSHLVSLNHIANPDLIIVGQVVRVSGGTVSYHQAYSNPVVHPAVYYHKATQKSAPVQQATPVYHHHYSSSASSSSSSSSGGYSNASLNYIAAHESTNNPNAVNPSSGTYGLFQFLPGTGPGAGASVAQQYAAAHSYAVSRYGGDAQAAAFWSTNHYW